MGLLVKAGTGQGYLKAGFQGFAGTGKTFTATRLAVGVRKFFSLKGPLAMWDSEGGSEYIAPYVKKETGQDLLVVRSRSFDDLLKSGIEAAEAGVSVFLADSMSHAWKDVCACYLARINEVRNAKNLPSRVNMEFQDWNPVKTTFAKWTDFYLNSPMHIIICGRGGYEYDYDTDAETGKKTLVKTGTKMKTENELGFEPSLLIEMEREQVSDGEGRFRLVHRAVVKKDRFDVLDGKECDNPSFDFFKPHIECLTPGAHAPVDTALKTDPGVNADGDAIFSAERRQRQIACEKIAAELDKAWAGTSAAAKKGRADALDKCFGTRSWTEIESMKIDRLREGFAKVRELVNAAPQEA